MYKGRVVKESVLGLTRRMMRVRIFLPSVARSHSARISSKHRARGKGVLGLTSRLATAGVAAAGQRRPQKSAEGSFEAAQCSHKSFRFACLGGR
jgi:hypothetical protein